MKKILIVGCGPSSQKVWGKEFNCDSFGVNGNFWHVQTDYWGCFDRHVFNEPGVDEFIESDISECYTFEDTVMDADIFPRLHRVPREGRGFGTDFDSLRNAGNSGANCCQIAYALGYRRFGLIGMDGYNTMVNPAMNYADKDYFEDWDKYPLPDINNDHIPMWNAFKTFCKHNDVEVVDMSTPGYGLFPRGNIEDFIR